MSEQIYSTPNAFPLLQSWTVKRFDTGLQNLTATYITSANAGLGDLQAGSSLTVDGEIFLIHPDPTVSHNTDAFDTINVSGYSILSGAAPSETVTKSVSTFTAWRTYLRDGVIDAEIQSQIPCIVEFATISKILGPNETDTVAGPSSPLKIYNTAGFDISSSTFTVAQLFPGGPTDVTSTMQLTPTLVSVSETKFGDQIKEQTFVHSVTGRIHFVISI
jgi:hypothetical protein